MNKKQILCACFAAAIMFVHLPHVSAEGEETGQLRVVFTGDLNGEIAGHSVYDEETDTYRNVGGYARLASLIQENKDEHTLVIDAGGHSSTSVFDGSTADILSTMGYDIIALGNEDIRYAKEEDALEGVRLLQSGISDFGEKEVIEDINSVKVGVFSLMGGSALAAVNDPSSNLLEKARKCAASLQEKGADYVICLFHGNIPARGKLLKKSGVKGIDLLICSDAYQNLEEPQKYGDTYIVSAGGYARSLGVADIDIEKKEITAYELVAVDGDIEEKPETLAAVKAYQTQHDQKVKEKFKDLDRVLGTTDHDLGDPRSEALQLAQSGTETLLADAYANAWHLQKHSGSGTAISLIPRDTVTGELLKGDITIKDLADVGVSGRKLVMAFVKGSDLIKLCEIDHSLGGQDPYFAMSIGNMNYRFLLQRSLYNRISDVKVQETAGYWARISKDNYYPVVMTDDMPARLEAADKVSNGVLNVPLRNVAGQQISSEELSVLKDYKGEEIDEMRALDAYITSFNRNEAGVHDISEQYVRNKVVRKEDVLSWRSWFRNTTAFAGERYKRLGIVIVGGIVILSVLHAIYKFIRRDHIRELY